MSIQSRILNSLLNERTSGFGGFVGKNDLLEEVLQEIKDLDLKQAEIFYDTIWKIINKYVSEGKNVMIPVSQDVSLESFISGCSLLKKKSPIPRKYRRTGYGRIPVHTITDPPGAKPTTIVDPPAGNPFGIRRSVRRSVARKKF